MNRRELLAAAAAAAVSLRPRTAFAQSRGRLVVVVGGGLAGLTAAYELRRAGFAVTVFEARDRVGGRVWTIRDPFGADQHGEAGGEFIDTSHRTLLGYARHFGLRLEDVRRSRNRGLEDVVYRDGKRQTFEKAAAPHGGAEIARFWSRVRALGAKIDAFDPVAAGAALDRRSAAWFLDRLELDPTARFFIEHELRDEFTVEPERLSLLHLTQDARLKERLDPSGAKALRIEGGNDQLPRAFAETIGASVVLDAPVERVEHGADHVRVRAAGEDVRADWCVLATPLPPLDVIDFEPPLPSVVRKAIQKLRYGTAAKTLLQYERRFWRQGGSSGDVLTDVAFQSSWEATDGQSGRPGILLAYTTGRNGALYESAGEGTRVLLAADELDDVFPGSRALLDVGVSASWHNQRYSGGTRVAYAPGQVTHFWRALRQPIGRLHLAGEHTDAYTGSMEGAVRSGRRAAVTIARRAA